MEKLNCVAERILIQRRKKKLTQLDVAIKLGVSQEAVSRYESKKSLPGAVSIAQLALILNVSADYLLGLSEDTQSAKPLREQFSPQEWELLCNFKSLSVKAKERALGYMQGAADNQ